MIQSFRGKVPRIAPSAFISDLAHIIGDVEIGENSSVWPGAVIRGDYAPIRIGNNTHIEDNSVIHYKVTIGDNVVIGHGTVVEALRIGNYVLIGNNATVLHDVEVDDFCIVGAGAMVRMGMKIPSHSFVVGVPAQIIGEASTERVEYLINFFPFAEMIEGYRKGR